MNKVTDPTPAPFPSCARLPVAFPLEGREVPHGVPAFHLEGREVPHGVPAFHLEGREVPHGVPAFHLEGREVPHGTPASGKAAAAPLPCRGGAGVGSVS